MYQSASQGFNSVIEQNGGRTFKARLKCSSFTLDTGFKKIKYTNASNSGDGITVGSAASGYIEVTLEKTNHVITGQSFSFDLGLEVDGVIEYMPMGIFKANKPEMTDYEMTFKAYDRMSEAEKNYASNLTYPTDTVSIMNEIAQKLDIEFVTNISPITLNNPNTEEGSSNVAFAGYTIREAIGYIAGLYGKFAIFNREGKLEFRWYEDNGFEVPVSKCFSFTKNESDYVVNKIIGITADNTQYEAGTGLTGISFSNPFVTQDIVNRINAEIGGFAYRGGEIKFLGDCRVDVWDIITGTDLSDAKYKMPVMEIVHEIDGGLTTTVSAKTSTGESVEDTYKGPVTKSMERTHTELLLVNTLLASKASIDYLESNYIKTNEIDAIEANIENAVIASLQGQFASIEYLEANYAEIDFSNVQKETVGTLLADVGLISDATIVDGHVTGVLGAVKIDAGNITLGVLDAGVIEVTNLKAANITVGQINGYQIAPGAIDMNNLTDSVTGIINTASTDATKALADALTAQTVANAAQMTADGKNTVFYQTSAPSGTHKVNDVWFDTGDSNKMYYWSGSAWTVRQFGTNAIANASITNALIADATIQSAKIANLDAGKITTGILDADRIGANTITANKLIIGDFTNYATVNENFSTTNIPTSTFEGTSISGGYIVKTIATNLYIMFCDYTPCNLKSGEQIYYEMSVKGAVSGTIRPKIWYYNASKGNTGSSSYTAHSVGTTETVISGTITTSSKADSASYFLVGIQDDSSSRNQIYVRRVKFIRKSSGNLIVDGAITAGKLSTDAVTTDKIAAGAVTAGTIAAGAITTDKIRAGSVTTDKLSVGNGGNLYATGYDTFENIPNVAARIYYDKSSRATVSIDTNTAYYGNKCLKISSTGIDGSVYLGDSSNGYGCIPVVAGKTYIVSAYMKSSATTNAQIYIVGHTAKNKAASHYSGVSATVKETWTRVYKSYTATADSPYISIRIDNDTDGTTLWVDAIQIETGTTTQEPSEFSPAGSTVIDGGNIITGTITAGKIAAGTITANELAADAVTANKISVADLSAISANLGTITAGILQSNNYTQDVSGMKLELNTGEWDSKYLKIANDGKITSTGGKIGGWIITDTALQSDYMASDEYLRRVYLQSFINEYNEDVWIYSIQKGTTKGYNPGGLDPIYYVKGNGNIYTKGGLEVSGNIYTKGEIEVGGNIYIENNTSLYGLTDDRHMVRIATIDEYDAIHIGDKNSYVYHEANLHSFRVSGESIMQINLTGLIPHSTEYQRNLGSPSNKWTYIYSDNSLQVSDIRHKHDIENIDERYMCLWESLKPKRFIINGSEDYSIGFIAQEIEKSIAESNLTLHECGFLKKDWVETPDYTGYEYSLNYNFISVLNCMALQSHESKIKELEDKLNEAQALILNLQQQLWSRA